MNTTEKGMLFQLPFFITLSSLADGRRQLFHHHVCKTDAAALCGLIHQLRVAHILENLDRV